MPAKLIELLSSHAGWMIILVVVVLMIGPTGIMAVIDRVLPPPEVAAVNNVGTEVGELRRSNSKKIDRVIDDQLDLIDAVRKLTDELNESALMFIRMERRVASLESWRAFLGTPMRRDPQNRWLTSPEGTP